MYCQYMCKPIGYFETVESFSGDIENFDTAMENITSKELQYILRVTL